MSTSQPISTPDEPLPDFDKLWDYDHPDQTERRFRELLPLARRSGNRDYHLQLLTQLARTLSKQRRFDEAHAILDEIEPQLTPDLPVPRIRYLLERGRCYNSAGDPAKAKPLFQQAFELAKSHGHDDYAIDAAHMLAITEAANPQAALNWNLQALDLAKSSPHPGARKWLASLQNNIAWTYHDQRQYDKALELFEDALRLRIEQGNPANIRIARWCVAKMHRLLGRAQQALEIQNQLHDELAAINEPDGYVYEERAECLLALNRAAEAKPDFAQAHQLLSKDPSFPPNETARLHRLRQLGEFQ